MSRLRHYSQPAVLPFVTEGKRALDFTYTIVSAVHECAWDMLDFMYVIENEIGGDKTLMFHVMAFQYGQADCPVNISNKFIFI